MTATKVSVQHNNNISIYTSAYDFIANPPNVKMVIRDKPAVEEEELIRKVAIFVKGYMAAYDASHDWHHILRVSGIANKIAAAAPQTYNPTKLKLAVLMHDVGDRKYLKPGENAKTLVKDWLLRLGADRTLADDVQEICSHVSYSHEVKDTTGVLAVISRHPELAVVQDADRLDAIGAVGIGRCFTFGGVASGREQVSRADQVTPADPGTLKNKTMADTMQHFDDKLVKLESMMKTDEGRAMAKERTDRLRSFMHWWEEESTVEDAGLDKIVEEHE